ncbi:hypothetical protein AX17_001195 [Amanita inopinata Kibby_2008]|nr:hypothetical protein AX17_001195 [Amanita inopinata Kibby_2008]
MEHRHKTIRKIDVHHHFFPDSLDKARANDLAQWRTPPGTLPWCAKKSIAAMDASGVDVAILSMPAIPAGSVGSEDRGVTRQHNLSMKNLCIEYPGRFGFFAMLPLLDIRGALDEIAFTLDTLNADGIALPSSYGTGFEAKYIGDDLYEPIWTELNRRSAVVFVHGTQTPSSTPCPSPLLGLPITEVPNETFKAAAHLVVTGRKRNYPDVKIILAHGGGSTIALAPRVAVLSEYMGCKLTAAQMLEDFRSFYYETALSAYRSNLLALDAFARRDRILFGTDYPAVSAEMADWYTKNLWDHYASSHEQLSSILSENALRLFPKFK